jgi:hypothetical protein
MASHVFGAGDLAPSGSICFGSLEFAIAAAGELRLVSTFAPAQTFHFGSLNFVTDALGNPQLTGQAVPRLGSSVSTVAESDIFEDAATVELARRISAYFEPDLSPEDARCAF